MANYKIVITETAERALYRLPKKIVPKIVAAIQSLTINPYPSGCRKLSGEQDTFRIRLGTYRIIYEIYKSTIEIKILKIGHRKDVYR